MGHKVSPLLLRLGYIQDWRSLWFAKKHDYAKALYQDFQIRKQIKENLKQAGIAKIVIERLADKVKIKIHTAKPGIIIGRHGQDIERLREDLTGMLKQELAIDVIEVKLPAGNAQLIAEKIGRGS